MIYLSGFNRLVCVEETECLSREVDTECVHTAIRVWKIVILQRASALQLHGLCCREQGNSSRSGVSAVGRRVRCRLLRCTSMPDPPVCWNWSMIYGRSLVFDISCTQLKTEIESRVSSRGSGRLLYTFSYAFFHFTMTENSNNSACLRYIDTTFEIGTTYCHLCRTNLKNGRCERDANCLASYHHLSSVNRPFVLSRFFFHHTLNENAQLRN